MTLLSNWRVWVCSIFGVLESFATPTAYPLPSAKDARTISAAMMAVMVMRFRRSSVLLSGLPMLLMSIVDARITSEATTTKSQRPSNPASVPADNNDKERNGPPGAMSRTRSVVTARTPVTTSLKFFNQAPTIVPPTASVISSTFRMFSSSPEAERPEMTNEWESSKAKKAAQSSTKLKSSRLLDGGNWALVTLAGAPGAITSGGRSARFLDNSLCSKTSWLVIPRVAIMSCKNLEAVSIFSFLERQRYQQPCWGYGYQTLVLSVSYELRI